MKEKYQQFFLGMGYFSIFNCLIKDLWEIYQNELDVCNTRHFYGFLNDVSVVSQGVALSEVRRELTLCKRTKIPILEWWRTQVDLSVLICNVSVSLLYRCSLQETPKGVLQYLGYIGLYHGIRYSF